MRSMYTYIERTPDLCRKIAEGAADRVAGLVEQFTLRPRTRLLIVASGSSYNIATAAKPYLQRVLGMEVTVTWPMSYILFAHAQATGTFVLCMSQSGKSTNTIEAVRRARECGQDVAVLTCNGNAPIREVCEHVYEYGSGVEDYYVAKGFPTSCTFLFEFAIAAARALGTVDGEEAEALHGELLAAIDASRPLLDASRTFFDRHMDRFVRARRIMCVGIGAGYGVALEGALKLNEMTGIAANAYEMEEFVHGPTYEIRKDHVIMLVDLGDVGHERMVQLHDALAELTDHVYVIDATGAYTGEQVFELGSPASGDVDALRAVVPFQVLAEGICSDLDMLSYNLNNFDFEQKMKTKA